MLTARNNNKITNSRKTAAMTCLRKHYLAYELGVRPVSDAKPLYMGSVFHCGLDAKAKGETVDEAIATALKLYDDQYHKVKPDDDYEWDIDREILARMLSVYFWRWGDYDKQCTVIASEYEFESPIFNPDTGRRSRNYKTGGMIDKILSLPDNRLAIMEHKTTSANLEPGSNYWRRLLIDSQISLYFNAAKRAGYDVEAIIYDVIRKPIIRPAKLTQGDTKILIETGKYYKALDGKGKPKTLIGIYRADVVSDNGEIAQVIINGAQADIIPGEKSFAIKETLEMYGDRLNETMSRDTDYYFARKEIARTDYELEEANYELWQIAKILNECVQNNRWPRNTSCCIGFGTCCYFDLCTSEFTADCPLPDKFVQIDNVHPELGDANNDENAKPAAAFVE